MTFHGKLINTDIAGVLDVVQTELERRGIEDKICMYYRLALEEMLLVYRDHLGDQAAFTLLLRKRNGNLNLRLSVAGESVNVLEEPGVMLRHILKQLRVPPRWSYSVGRNWILTVLPLYTTTLKNLKFTWRFTAKSRKTLAVSLACQILSAVLGIVAPMVSAQIIIAYTSDKAEQVIYIAIVLLAVQILRNFFLVFSNQGYNRAYSKTLGMLEKELIDTSLQVESQCMDEKGSGLFIQRITTDTQRIASGFNNIADMISQVLNYVSVMLAMFLVHPLIAVFVAVIVGVQFAMESWRTRRMSRDDRIFRSANEHFSGLVGEMVRGARDVTLLNSEERYSTELQSRLDDANSKRLRMQARSWRAKLVRWEFGELGTFALITLLAFLITRGRILPAIALVIYNYYTDLGPNAIKVISTFMDSIADFNISSERVYALLNSPEFPKERFGDVELTSPRGEISFEHVSFSYRPEEPKPLNVLNDMSFTIRPGEMIGLVGKSGCGKSTTFNLISRLYEPTAGRVLLDGVDMKNLTRESIRSNMTVVTQNPYIFRMSVRENLKLVKEDMTDGEMTEVCRLACLDEDILKMPEGYDTMIGEGGVNLSGGQRQRLAIARSMLRNSRIILFDEATSALDNTTQARIQEAIDNLRKDRTVIIIAHRLSTIRNADRIIYMQSGQVFAEGTYEELLRTCKPFQELAAMDKIKDSGEG
ncbi:MAG: ABC transporter ATP-binding protein [Clostridia bacterium]|nr:ABC transporter ATP-binding protein [Clostridia bacterium]